MPPKTKADALKLVDKHWTPKDCAVELESSAAGYRPIPGTGCAHWVAHQKGINGAPGCADGRAIRVSQVIAGKSEYKIREAAVGDIWVQPGGGHTGIVRSLTKNKDGIITELEVEHCSSGQGGVVKSKFTTGACYR